MAQDSNRRHTTESFRPDEKVDYSIRPTGSSKKPNVTPIPIDIGGPSIVEIPVPKASEKDKP